jgi:hypothetical protein
VDYIDSRLRNGFHSVYWRNGGVSVYDAEGFGFKSQVDLTFTFCQSDERLNSHRATLVVPLSPSIPRESRLSKSSRRVLFFARLLLWRCVFRLGLNFPGSKDRGAGDRFSAQCMTVLAPSPQSDHPEMLRARRPI